jgi:hypothetical protein
VDLALFVTGLAGPGRGFRDETSKETNEDAERERARFSKLRVALGEIREVTLEPGDTLYIPPFWWHHVATLDDVQTRVEEKTETVSVSLLLAFDPNGDESVHPCVEEDGYG